MCGIFGIYSLKGDREFNTTKIESSISTMKHRGPDASDFRVLNNKSCLAHLRLSIIDPKPESNQPFNLDDRYWITYNGEIYNYLELKEELIKSYNISFKTESDTEVLLYAYIYWGVDCVKKFNGMWAFAIYDSHTDILFCSRDRFGVKPFNYSIHNDTFIFGSEIKPILNYYNELSVPNYNVIANFCRTSTGAQIEETWFENILRLPPASNLLIKDNKIVISSYWQYPTILNKDIDFDKAKETYKNLFIDAVKLRLRSDVPLGTTLSSGLDSTSIVSCIKKLSVDNQYTFTAKFEENSYESTEKSIYSSDKIRINESDIVNKLANELNLNSNLIDIKYNNFVKELSEIIYYLESGNSSPATFPLMKVMENAKKKVTVVLEGQGADEMLLGYLNPLFIPVLIQLLKQFKLRQALQFYKSFKSIYSVKYSFLLYVRSLLNQNTLIRWLYKKYDKKEKIYEEKLKNYKFIKDYPKKEIKNEDVINDLLIKQHTGGLVNLLHYGDAISMAHSIESRLPFMDYRLVEFVFSLPWQYKAHNNLTKLIHRKAMEGIVPQFILNNPYKFGFNSPLADKFVMNEKGNSEAVEILLSDRCINRKLFHKSELQKLLVEHNTLNKNHAPLLFRLLSVELWFRVFIDTNE